MPITEVAAVPFEGKRYSPWIEDRLYLSIYVGEHIAYLRHRNRWSQKTLAEAMSAPRQYISKVECGRVLPLGRTLRRFTAIFGVGVDELMPDPRVIRTAREKSILADPFLSQIAALVPCINRGDRKIIENTARSASEGQYTFGEWIAV